ncbi:hypothetical protein GSI_02635 [Ganoderma sinense ZZ0214-1]|uniref:Uncharacterized protein n=1 Tax=Ganoderma sinense ZZ0214-1 TaxID=1077348 RepID=A0A2G8RW70_9APHY|nr:hypothetical protein GSI_11509 [Ganoderma sinense ZZ0214-1]PIL34848.1 hypothetical protein GSI_02635 [Ganoderma sinense ZZ0214-1]
MVEVCLYTYTVTVTTYLEDIETPPSFTFTSDYKANERIFQLIRTNYSGWVDSQVHAKLMQAFPDAYDSYLSGEPFFPWREYPDLAEAADKARAKWGHPALHNRSSH